MQNNSDLIKRDIFDQVINHLQEKEMTVIIGPRQVGKTTLLEQIKDYLMGLLPNSIFDDFSVKIRLKINIDF